MGRKVLSPERIKINKQHREVAESKESQEMVTCGVGVYDRRVWTRTGAHRRDHSLVSLACSCFQAKCLLVTLCAANSESFLEIK